MWGVMGWGVWLMMQETVWKNGVDSIKCLGGMGGTSRLRVRSWNGGRKWGKRALKVKDELCKRTSDVR